MKKLILAIILTAILAAPAWAVDWINNPAPTLVWDAVTQDVDGDPVDPGSVTYQVVLAEYDGAKVDYEVVATTTDTTISFNLPAKGIYYVGVRAYNEFGESEINWADEPEDQPDVEPWGLRWGAPPRTPRNVQ